jgi:hypothetical protein
MAEIHFARQQIVAGELRNSGGSHGEIEEGDHDEMHFAGRGRGRFFCAK